MLSESKNKYRNRENKFT